MTVAIHANAKKLRTNYMLNYWWLPNAWRNEEPLDCSAIWWLIRASDRQTVRPIRAFNDGAALHDILR